MMQNSLKRMINVINIFINICFKSLIAFLTFTDKILKILLALLTVICYRIVIIYT